MAAAQETFGSVVIEPLKVSIGGKTLSYAEYLELPANLRSNDEADVVDIQFTQNMLKWLGYDSGDIIYNRPLSGHPGSKPDFVVKMLGATAFVIEDKSTDEHFDSLSVKQLRRYATGTSGYCLWTNARSILGLRFDANGQYQTLVEVRVDGIFGYQKSLYPQEANFELLHLLFSKHRFTDISTLIGAVARSEEEWKQDARPLTDEKSLQAFIAESRFVLDQLTTAIKAHLNTVTIELDEAVHDVIASQQKYSSIVSRLLDKLKGGGGVKLNEITKLEAELRALEPILADADIVRIKKPSMSTATLSIWRSHIQEIGSVISTLRERELARAESRRVRAAYLLWRERYKIIEGAENGNGNGSEIEAELRRQQAFAEQVSYVFFVRLLLTRVLEDKGLMPHLVSDGGFSAWYDFIKGYGLDNVDEIGGEAFLPLVYRRVGNFYRHFFQQPVFDWFLPDDYLLALVLHRLNTYNFKDVTSDLLGFTYEAFIDRVARNKKGHFLTPPAIVEYMLDRAGYNTSAVIGEKLLDPACGSGSFLVHAARRLRQTLASTMAGKGPAEIARMFIDQVKTNLVGLEVNPFSCYLAELNLFIQVLDDLVALWKAGEHPDIERFAIYNTNSLEMPPAVLQSERNNGTTTLVDYSAALDDAAPVKVRQGDFGYVICNPPYVNRGIILEAKSYGEFPFYREVVKGDENFYLLFLRLAAYYTAPGGSVCFICPLNLLGDESTMRTREMFCGADWSIQSITRFYVRDVLFPGVLQGVCVVRLDHTPGQLSDKVEVRGGDTVEEAAQTAILVQRSRITHNYPEKALWSKPWLVNANPEVYELWRFVRENTQQDLADLIHEKMKVYEGDARSTWAKPMLVPRLGPKIVPLTKGKDIVDWGGWSAASYLDPSVSIPSSIKDYRSCLWVQKQVQRVASLTQTETVIFLKEVSGLEMKRPIRGTITQRNGQHPVVADHTVLVMYTQDVAHEDLAYAVFGLIASSTYNFLFSLFSTNAHANFKEIMRLPVPVWSISRMQQLADGTRNVLHAYEELYTHEGKYGTDQARHVLENDVLLATRLPTLRLEELVLRGEVIMNGASHHTLEVLLNRGQLTINQNLQSDVVQVIERFVRASGNLPYAKGGKDILLPNPRVASLFLSQLHTLEQERAAKLQAATLAQHALDDMVLDAYGITVPSWRAAIEMGVPWARN